MGVEEGELGTRVGALAPTDHPHVIGPALDLVELAQLDDLGARSDCPVEFSRPHPVLFLGQEKSITNRTADGKADRVLEVGL